VLDLRGISNHGGDALHRPFALAGSVAAASREILLGELDLN